MQQGIGWVLSGISPNTLGKESIERMLSEAFDENVIYRVYVCGADVNRPAGLSEAEDAYRVLREGMEDYELGDFGIVYEEEEGKLLFFPTEIEEQEDEEISRSDDSLQG